MKNGRLSVLVDCSRNAVLNISNFKHFIGILSQMGYNTIFLYMEDTYEIKNEPLFGYMRGRYSYEELREIVDFAEKKGIEVIPCIQTLAHMNCLFMHEKFACINDINDILLVDDEKTYELIEQMFVTIENCFKSKYVHIGMDEAFNLGRGKYLSKHGYILPKEIFLKHLNRVLTIVKKHNFTPLIWSDMVYSLDGNSSLNDSISLQIPNDVEFVNWNYSFERTEDYKEMLGKYLSSKKTWFAGGAWKWGQFTPWNNISLRRIEASFKACDELSVNNRIITLWGDDGAECSIYAVLPSLFYASECYKGNYDIEIAKQKFKEMFNESFDNFLLYDMYLSDDLKKCFPEMNGAKGLFYSDCFVGKYESTVSGKEDKYFKEYENKFRIARDNSKSFSFLFETYRRYSDFLSVKSVLGYNTRLAYKNKNFHLLKKVIKDYAIAIKKLQAFYTSYKNLWLHDNKAFGLEVTDIRIGGLILRLQDCRLRLIDYLKGKISSIEELDSKLVDLKTGSEDVNKVISACYYYKSAVTSNRLS